MTIDIKARNRIIREREQKSLVSQLISSLKPPEKEDTLTEPTTLISKGTTRNGNLLTIIVGFVQKILKVVGELKESSPSAKDVQDVKEAVSALTFPEIEIPSTITLNQEQLSELTETFKNIKIPEPKDFPSKMDVGISTVVKKLELLEDILSELEVKKITEVKGTVDIKHMPELDLTPLIKAIKEIKVNIPKLGSDTSKIDMSPVTLALNEFSHNFASITENNNDDVVKMLRQVNDSISALVDKPTFVPPTVTNININALQGIVKTTNMTISTAVVAIPTSTLDNRRSIQVYNNSTNTLYIGGSDVTTTNGIPVPSYSFSQALDMGKNMTLYGIATGSSNIRILEISSEASGR